MTKNSESAEAQAFREWFIHNIHEDPPVLNDRLCEIVGDYIVYMKQAPPRARM